MISQRAIDLIISCEVSSRAYYEKHYQHPEWPGGSSGVTVGIGYDLGYTNRAKLHADWDGKLSDSMIKVMERCIGVHGDAAHTLLGSVRAAIVVPWDPAMEVFIDRDVPEYTQDVIRAIPAAASLPPDCLGALVSLAYNRGASFNNSGDRYREMRAIKAHIIAGNLVAVATDIREMKRLWSSNTGLPGRREAEAKLWETGLKTPALAPAKHAPTENPPPALPAPTNTASHGSAAGTAAATAGAAKQAHDSGFSTTTVVIVVVVGLLIAAAVWFGVRKYRAAPVVARIKDQPDGA